MNKKPCKSSTAVLMAVLGLCSAACGLSRKIFLDRDDKKPLGFEPIPTGPLLSPLELFRGLLGETETDIASAQAIFAQSSYLNHHMAVFRERNVYVTNLMPPSLLPS